MFSRLEDFRFARWAKSLNRSLQILFALTLVAGLNILAATHFERWDLTANHRFSLSPETLAYLSQIPRDKPVEISLILPEGQVDENERIVLEQTRALLKEYVYEAARVQAPGATVVGVPLTIEEIDQFRQGEKIKALEALGCTPYTYIMVVCGERGHPLTKTDLYESMGRTATAFKGESAITSAILDVIQTKPDPILFTIGHGEMRLTDPDPSKGISNLGLLLKAKNYSLDEINLAKEEKIPDDTKLVVVASPLVAFQPYEVEKLRRYLDDKNGRVLIFLESGDDHGLDTLLAEWGLRSHDWRVIDPKNTLPDEQIAIDPGLDNKRTSNLTQFLAQSGLSVVLGKETRPVEIDPDAPADDRRQIHELLATSGTSFAETTVTSDLNGHNSAVVPGPFVVAALSERRATDAVDLPGGRVLVFGNADFIANRNFSDSGNPDLILNCVNYLANRENMVNIPSKAPTQTQLNITNEQFTGLAWRLAMVPAVVAMLGMMVFWVRNRT